MSDTDSDNEETYRQSSHRHRWSECVRRLVNSAQAFEMSAHGFTEESDHSACVDPETYERVRRALVESQAMAREALDLLEPLEDIRVIDSNEVQAIRLVFRAAEVFDQNRQRLDSMTETLKVIHTSLQRIRFGSRLVFADAYAARSRVVESHLTLAHHRPVRSPFSLDENELQNGQVYGQTDRQISGQRTRHR
jgi:hypothetical protein